MNEVNINQFQFEYDLTWMAFFQNSEGRTYTRYGGREDSGPESHLNKASLLRVMRQVLTLHQTNSVQPVSKYEPVPRKEFTPEEIPPMNKMIAKRKVKCIHCHDVKVAKLRDLDEQSKLLKEMVYTYPAPSGLGILLNPQEQNVIERVKPNSIAAKAGLRSNDVLQSADSQRILTFADFTRVLELSAVESQLDLKYTRNGKSMEANLNLTGDWRKNADPSWRSSMHAVGPGGGFWGVPLNAQQRKNFRIAEDKLALKANVVWSKQAKQAGIRNGDVVVSIDGQTKNMNARQMHSHLNLNRNWGDTVEVVVLRGGKKLNLKLKLADKPH